MKIWVELRFNITDLYVYECIIYYRYFIYVCNSKVEKYLHSFLDCLQIIVRNKLISPDLGSMHTRRLKNAEKNAE